MSLTSLDVVESVELKQDGATQYQLVTLNEPRSASAVATHTWRVPAPEQPADDYRVRLMDPDQPNVGAYRSR